MTHRKYSLYPGIPQPCGEQSMHLGRRQLHERKKSFYSRHRQYKSATDGWESYICFAFSFGTPTERKCSLTCGSDSSHEIYSPDAAAGRLGVQSRTTCPRKPVSICRCVLDHVPAPRKLLVPWGWPLLGLVMLLTSFLFSHKTGTGPNPNLDYSSWEEVVLHTQSFNFITWLVIRKYWKTLTISKGTWPNRITAWTTSSHSLSRNLSLKTARGWHVHLKHLKREKKQYCTTS